MGNHREFDIKVFRIVSQVLEQPMSVREQLLGELCEGQETLLKACGEFVIAFQDPNSFLEEPAMGDFMEWASTISQIPTHEIPKTIGAYRVIDRLGQGGMGQVFRVKHPGSNKHYALKLLMNPNQDRRLLARFLREQKAHALMNHVNIPGYHDSGFVEGHPFFLMDYVHADGNLMEFIKQRKVSLEKRLQLFLQLCDGIAHAHRRMVIHRDLKPSNVLVEKTDEKPLVKIVDFGIAAEVGADLLLEAQEARTIPGTIIGTWIYIAPEMLDATKNQVAIDVFGLGMMLFEMLTGEQPRNGARMKDMSLKQAMAYIQEPVVRRGDELQVQYFDSGKQAKMPLDLKRILAKATQPDPDQRYADVGELVADVVAYQQGRPLRTQYTPVLRRFGKHVMRFKLVSGLALALMVLIGGIAYKDFKARQLELQKVELESSFAKIGFLFDGWDKISSVHNSNGNPGLEQEVINIAKRLSELVEKDPKRFAPMLGSVARMLENMGLYEAAISHYEIAAKGIGQTTELGLEWERRAIYARHLFGQSEAALKLLEIYEAKAEAHGHHLQVLRAQRNKVTILRIKGRLNEALNLLSKVISSTPLEAPLQDRYILLLEHARVLLSMGDLNLAIKHFSNAWQMISLEAGPYNPEVVDAMYGMASVLSQKGKYEESNLILMSMFEVMRRNLSELDPSFAKKRILHVINLNLQGNHKEALEIGQEVRFVFEKSKIPVGLRVAQIDYEIGYSYMFMRKYPEAIKKFRSVFLHYKFTQKKDDLLALAHGNLAECLISLGNYEEAEFILRRLHKLFENVIDRKTKGIITTSYITLAETLFKQMRYREALNALNEAEPGVQEFCGSTSIELGALNLHRGFIYHELGKSNLAKENLVSGLSLTKNYYEDHSRRAKEILKSKVYRKMSSGRLLSN